MTLLKKILTLKPNIKKSVSAVFFTVVISILIIFGGIKAFATQQPCSLTINVTTADNSAQVSQIKVGLCKIASLQEGKYELTDAFSTSGISVENILNKTNSNHNAEIYRYVIDNNITYDTATTNSEGSAVFSNLNQGIYLVFCENSQSLTFSPYMVSLPAVVNGNLVYNVTSEPKTINSKDNVKNIYVKILWHDNNNYGEKRPQTIIITLLRNGKPYKTAELSEACNWEYTFRDVPADGVYTIRQGNIDHYETYYEGDAENGFTVTNILITESPIMSFVKTGINNGAIPIAIIILISVFVLIVISRKKAKK